MSKPCHLPGIYAVKPRNRRVAATLRLGLSREMRERIYREWRAGRSMRALARKYSLTMQAVDELLRQRIAAKGKAR